MLARIRGNPFLVGIRLLDVVLNDHVFRSHTKVQIDYRARSGNRRHEIDPKDSYIEVEGTE